MPVPSPRNPIRPARGNKADLVTHIVSLYDGELCYAIDEDRLYINEGGTLVAIDPAVSGTDPFSTEINGASNGDALVYNGGKWKNGGMTDCGNF